MFDSISFLRIIKTGFVNFLRNRWLSATATIVMVITLVIFSILFLLFGVTSYSVSTIRERVDVSVYLKKGLVEDRIMALKTQLQADPQIKEVDYVSAEQALADFKQKHVSSDNIIQAVNELDENPLLATLHIKANNLDDYPKISEKLAGPQYQGVVEKVNFNDNREVIDRLNRILKIIVGAGLGLTGIFSIIAILVIFNALALTIYNRKEEVEIMRLVGATNWYIRGPFLTEAVIYSFFSTIITGFLLIPIFRSFLPKIGQFVNPQVSLFNQNIFNYWYLLLILLLLSLILSTFSTLLAIRKYLKI